MDTLGTAMLIPDEQRYILTDGNQGESLPLRQNVAPPIHKPGFAAFF
jgi:hypothetical protein